jgi:hypothetical protein
MEPSSATQWDTFSEPPNSPSISSTSQASSSSGTPTASQFQTKYPYIFDDDDDDPNYILINNSPFNFTNLQLRIIRDAIQHILLPTRVQ